MAIYIKSFFLLSSLFLFSFGYAQIDYTERLSTGKGKTKGATPIGVTSKGVAYCASYKGRSRVNNYYKIIDFKTGSLLNEKYYKRDKKTIALRPINAYIRIKDHNPLLIIETLEDKITSFYGFKLDDIGNINSTPYLLTEGESCSDHGLLSSKSDKTAAMWWTRDTISNQDVFITDHSCIKSENGPLHSTLRIVHYDDGLTNRDEQIITLPKATYSIDMVNYINGQLYLMCSNYERKKVKGRLFKTSVRDKDIYKIDREGTIQHLSLPKEKGPFLTGHYTLQEENGEMVVSGTLHERGESKNIKNSTDQIVEKEGVKGVLHAQLDFQEQKLTNIQTHLFGANFITKYWSEDEKDKAVRRKNIDDDSWMNSFAIMDHLKASDGGYYTIFQNKYVYDQSYTDSRGQYRQRVYYYYTTTIVAKTTSDGEYEWVKQVPTFNVYLNYNPGSSMQCLVNGEQLSVMHSSNEDIRYKIVHGQKNPNSRNRDRIDDHIAVTTLDQEGNLIYSTAFPLEGDEYKIRSFNGSLIEKYDGEFGYFEMEKGLFSKKKTTLFKILLED